MSNELPATNWLGYSVDMLSSTPLDIKSVSESVKKARRIILYYPDEDTRPVTIGDEVFDVPRCIGIAKDISSVQGNYITYKSGSEASQSFQVDASLSVRYLAVSGSASASYATEKSFRQENQYAFYSFNADTYSASLRDYADLLNESALKRRIEDLPVPFNGTNPEHVKDWREFFSSFGTHAIINCSYGARFQLNVWASNSESSMNQRFSVNVQASFNGLVAGGDFDASVKGEEQYKTFEEFMQRLVSIQGGDMKLAASLGADPTQMDVYKQWAESTATYSNLCNFHVVELWSLLRDAASKDLRDVADTVQDAYQFMTNHTSIYRTRITMTIESDWAEFGLLTPSAVLIPDPDSALPSTNTVFSETRVQWGKEHSHDYQRMDVRFVVINDGSPIDFYISHGSNGGQQGKGRATVIVENNQYTNDQITDNNWNTVWFYQKPVSGKAEATNMTTRGLAHSWNNLLNSYLIEIGVKAPESDDADNEVGALDTLLSVTPSADPVPTGAEAWQRFEEVTKYLPTGKRLFRSSAPHYDGEDEIQTVTESDVQFLQTKGINGIISLNEFSYDSSSLALLKKYKIDYLHRPVIDFGSPTQADFAAANTFFLAHTVTLIHCGYGHGRTGTGVTALQLYATKGANPPESDWSSVNHVEKETQIQALRQLKQSLQ